MTLNDAVRDIDLYDQDATIYAAEPWSPASLAVVAHEPESGGLPTEACGMKYFIEVFVARDFIKDWAANGAQQPSLIEKCQRLIDFAIHDA